ncbi:unnamed protein product [Hymenolepis diminuta]|uniref:Uncharacterized protein n=1 Tax=Hymenolepis diminuta TaxID=6216 RepID=A0A564XY72_HYMDI|nr:unnamed protein product [Hymenolepis diminuta]
MSKRAHRFPPALFYNGLASPKKHICAHVLAQHHPSDSYKVSLVYPTRITHTGQLRTPTFLALSLSLSLSPSFSPSLCYALWIP